MSPNRIIKESILTSESIDALSETAEILFYRLLVIADDQGRFMASPGYLLSATYPLLADRTTDPKDIADIMQSIAANCQQIAAAGIISLYKVQGRNYGCFNKWEDHQRIRNVRPKHPGPEESNDNEGLEVLRKNGSRNPQVADNNPQDAAGSAPNPIRIQSESESNQKTCVSSEFLFELDIVELYSQHFPPPKYPQLTNPTGTKQGEKVLRQIRARSREMKWGEEISPWSDYFKIAGESHWLTHEMRYFNLDWLTRPTNFQKVIEGNYKDKGGGQQMGRGVEFDALSPEDEARFGEYDKD